jgi:hypothetical protein
LLSDAISFVSYTYKDQQKLLDYANGDPEIEKVFKETFKAIYGNASRTFVSRIAGYYLSGSPDQEGFCTEWINLVYDQLPINNTAGIKFEKVNYEFTEHPEGPFGIPLYTGHRLILMTFKNPKNPEEIIKVYLDNGTLGGRDGIGWEEDIKKKTTWIQKPY